MACPGCGSDRTEAFFHAAGAPVLCNVLSATREAAEAVPRGEIRLEVCPVEEGGCGLVFNAAFDEGLLRYSGTYENALHFSAEFRRYAEGLARDLIERHGVSGKRVVEIGCGDGSFLSMLCELGENEGIGFDPAHDAGRSEIPREGAGARVRVVRELYGPESARRAGVAGEGAALVVCRHTLEHVWRPREFLGAVREAVGEEARTVVFFEVPDLRWTLERMGIWDILYEHCLYFTAGSLWRTFEGAGLRPRRCASVYGGQFVTIEAGGNGEVGARPDDSDVTGLARQFGRRYEEKVGAWRERLRDLAQRGERAVLWGAGTKGVMFLNIMGDDARAVEAVVDVNPRKHGHFIAGTGQRIIGPGELAGVSPSVVIIMNPVYRGEIERDLERLGVRSAVEVA